MINVDISRLPADVRKTYKNFKVLHAEKKIQNRAKQISCPLLSVYGLNL
jgi:hypothetical protein